MPATPATGGKTASAGTLAPERPLKDRAVPMTVYLLPDDHRRLRMLVAEEGSSFQSLVMDGVDRVLAERGMAPLARWDPRRKKR